MIKSFITHKVLETCIELIFDGISNSFATPSQDLEIVGDIEYVFNNDSIAKHMYIYNFLYKGKIYRIGMSSNVHNHDSDVTKDAIVSAKAYIRFMENGCVND